MRWSVTRFCGKLYVRIFAERSPVPTCRRRSLARSASRSEIIWSKPHFVIGRGNYHPKHEPCWYGVRKGGKAHWIGDRNQHTVWEIAAKAGIGSSRVEDAITEHTNQKPLECMARPMRNHEGDVADFFAGSGTSIIAAQKLGRRCYALELDPGWCDVIVERWKALTGGAPERRAQAVAA